MFARDVYPLACPAWLLGVSCGRAVFLLHPVWAGKCVIPPWMSNLQAGPTPGLWLPAKRTSSHTSSTAQHEPLRNAYVSTTLWTCWAGRCGNLSDCNLHRLTLRQAWYQLFLVSSCTSLL